MKSTELDKIFILKGFLCLQYFMVNTVGILFVFRVFVPRAQGMEKCDL